MQKLFLCLIFIPILSWGQSYDADLNTYANDLIYLYKQANNYCKSNKILKSKFYYADGKTSSKELTTFKQIGSVIHNSKSSINKIVVNGNHTIDIKNNKVKSDPTLTGFAANHLNYLNNHKDEEMGHDQTGRDYEERMENLHFYGYLSECISLTFNGEKDKYQIVKDAISNFYKHRNLTEHWLEIVSEHKYITSYYLTDGYRNYVLVLMSDVDVKNKDEKNIQIAVNNN